MYTLLHNPLCCNRNNKRYSAKSIIVILEHYSKIFEFCTLLHNSLNCTSNLNNILPYTIAKYPFYCNCKQNSKQTCGVDYCKIPCIATRALDKNLLYSMVQSIEYSNCNRNSKIICSTLFHNSLYCDRNSKKKSGEHYCTIPYIATGTTNKKTAVHYCTIPWIAIETEKKNLLYPIRTNQFFKL